MPLQNSRIYFRAINYDYDEGKDFAQVCLYTHICICIYAYMDECQHKNSGQNIQTSPAMSMPENIENIQNCPRGARDGAVYGPEAPVRPTSTRSSVSLCQG